MSGKFDDILQASDRMIDANDRRQKSGLAALHKSYTGSLLHHHLVLLSLTAAMGCSAWTWHIGYWPLTMLCWVAAAQLAHNKAILFHEASHRTIHANQWINEAIGVSYGTVMLTPLSVYRYAHAIHHARLAMPDDPELWPFVVPGASRLLRVTAAILELSFGVIYTPFLFLKSVIVGCEPIARDQRIRMMTEYALILGNWGGLIFVVARYGLWEPWLVGMVIPLWLAGNLQTLNKYIEHLGLTGDSALTATRTVAATSVPGSIFSASLLHVTHHGTHHRYPKVPYEKLPAATSLVYQPETAHAPVYSSYLRAMIDMLPALADPRAGRLANNRQESIS